jgi:RimJ/RimL family protein N-acetyltransferase
VTLEGHGVRLEPLAREHHDGLIAAARDGEHSSSGTSVPAPEETDGYIVAALAGRQSDMLPWAVRDLATGAIVGSTRYHDIVPAVDRVEIGYTWYALRCQKSHVNTACKLLLSRAFEGLGCSGRLPHRQLQFH